LISRFRQILESFLVMTVSGIHFKEQIGETLASIRPKGCVWIFRRKLAVPL